MTRWARASPSSARRCSFSRRAAAMEISATEKKAAAAMSRAMSSSWVAMAAGSALEPGHQLLRQQQFVELLVSQADEAADVGDRHEAGVAELVADRFQE